jgi:predicted GIY-YIG superfamily endonuclease
MSNYCYVYVLRSLADGQFYVGLTRDLRAGCKRITKALLRQQKGEGRSNLCIGRAA